MKYLFLLLITFPVLACQVSVPTSEAQRIIDALPSGVPPLWSCKDKPEEKCHCVGKIQWEFADWEDDYVIDYVAQRQYESCVKAEYSEEFPEANLYQDCDDKFSSLVCTEGNPIKNYETLSVYCAVNVMKVEGKKLVESSIKKTAYEAIKEAKKIAREAKIAAKEANKVELFALKKADIDAMTVSQRNAVTMKILNILQEIAE